MFTWGKRIRHTPIGRAGGRLTPIRLGLEQLEGRTLLTASLIRDALLPVPALLNIGQVARADSGAQVLRPASEASLRLVITFEGINQGSDRGVHVTLTLLRGDNVRSFLSSPGQDFVTGAGSSLVRRLGTRPEAAPQTLFSSLPGSDGPSQNPGPGSQVTADNETVRTAATAQDSVARLPGMPFFLQSSLANGSVLATAPGLVGDVLPTSPLRVVAANANEAAPGLVMAGVFADSQDDEALMMWWDGNLGVPAPQSLPEAGGQAGGDDITGASVLDESSTTSRLEQAAAQRLDREVVGPPTGDEAVSVLEPTDVGASLIVLAALGGFSAIESRDRPREKDSRQSPTGDRRRSTR